MGRRSKEEERHVHVWLMHFAVQQKLTHHCKATLCLRVKSCPTLCDSVGCSPPGSPVHGILQARILEWGAISFSRGSSSSRDQTPSLLPVLHWQAGSLPLAPPGKPQSNYTPIKKKKSTITKKKETKRDSSFKYKERVDVNTLGETGLHFASQTEKMELIFYITKKFSENHKVYLSFVL